MDFSPSELYQYVDQKKKFAKIMTPKEWSSKENFEKISDLLSSAKSQLFFFSGNLTFSNIGWHDKKIHQIMEELAENNIPSKILTRVELPGIENIKNILAINDRIGKQMIEVRHCFQPLRGSVIDNQVAYFKEMKDPKDYVDEELVKKIIIQYYIYDKDWLEWLQKVFWNLFRVSIPAEKRVKDLEAIKGFYSL